MREKSRLKKSAAKVLKFLFPVNYTCNVCDRECFDGGYYCADCEKTLPRNDLLICGHCGRHVFNPEEYCYSCRGRETGFEKARSVFVYAEPIKKMIADFKYRGMRYLSEVFASDMAKLYYKSFFNSDVIVFPPMSEERLRERGYNQAELLAEELSALINVPVAKGALVKVKETERQATLSAEERKRNLSGTFKVADSSALKGKNVLIVDDVMTTGATVEAISFLLIKCGAKKTDVLSVASVSGGAEGKSVPHAEEQANMPINDI